MSFSFPLLPAFAQDQHEAPPSSFPYLLSTQPRQLNFVADLHLASFSIPANLFPNATPLPVSRSLPPDTFFVPSEITLSANTLLLPIDSCSSSIQVGLLSTCLTPRLPKFAFSEDTRGIYLIKPVQPAPRPSEKFHWKPALWQSFGFLVVAHAFRLANDPGARYNLFHKPFWYDYWASAANFHMSRWGDGDNFLVNYIGHPMEGAVAGDIFLNSDPKGRSARFGKSSSTGTVD